MGEVREAASEGDLSENAGLDAAKRTLGLVEAQIRHLERRLADAEIVEQDGQPERIDVGVIVTLEDLDTSAVVRYRITDSMEMDLSSPVKTATPNSPIGLALLGRGIGDEIVIQRHTRAQRFRIIALEWDGAEPSLSTSEDEIPQSSTDAR